MGKRLEVFDGCKLLQKEIIGQRKVDDVLQEIKRTAFILLENKKIIRVWWDNRPSPEEIISIIKKRVVK